MHAVLCIQLSYDWCCGHWMTGGIVSQRSEPKDVSRKNSNRCPESKSMGNFEANWNLVRKIEKWQINKMNLLRLGKFQHCQCESFTSATFACVEAHLAVLTMMPPEVSNQGGGQKIHFFSLDKVDCLQFHLKQNLTSMVQFIVGSHASGCLMMFHRSPKTIGWILKNISKSTLHFLVKLLSLKDEIHPPLALVILARLSLWGLFEANFEVFHLISCKGLRRLDPFGRDAWTNKNGSIHCIHLSFTNCRHAFQTCLNNKTNLKVILVILGLSEKINVFLRSCEGMWRDTKLPPKMHVTWSHSGSQIHESNLESSDIG